MGRVLITGASAGLGWELARLFAADGFDLVLTGRRAERLDDLAANLRRDYEVEVLCLPCDLTVAGAVESLLAGLDKAEVGVNGLVNNAGFGAYGSFVERDWATYDDLIQLNITALTHLTRALLPGMLETAAGTPPPLLGVMNVASTAAFQPGPLMAAYFASKAYVLSFSEALHQEMAGTSVKVCAFCPGPTRTEFFTTDCMIPTGVVGEDGAINEADLQEYNRRDAKRMSVEQAALVGYRGFREGRAVVIPGLRNRLMAWLAPRLSRGFVRRLTHRMLSK